MRKEAPVLHTDRLILRPFNAKDASLLAELAGQRDIADTMISVAHPLSLEQAQCYIAQYQEQWESGHAVTFALALQENAGKVIGSVALRDIDREHEGGELSFWIAGSAQGNGYVTEAARRVLSYAFNELDLNRVYAYHMVRNAASGRVLAKLGMVQEGCLRQRVRKWGVYEDVLLWAKLRCNHHIKS